MRMCLPEGAFGPKPHQASRDALNPSRTPLRPLLLYTSANDSIFTMVHNRDVLVNCIKRYYDLLIRAAYLDPNAIETPPPSGWTDEQLEVDILRVLGRSETVIDLLRHIPYIKSYLTHRQHNPRYEVLEETVAINYLRTADLFEGATAEECKGKTLDDFCLMPVDAEWPAGFISLTGGREATSWVIDTDEGTTVNARGEGCDAA
jgi:hypothetical protein